ncbi:MAG: hypothetical protein KGD65_12840 [Candidatus Lokiarchaeota archaeon]|nr:hypothetical protein [Candidatus Lokiarchaeota archaeon]
MDDVAEMNIIFIVSYTSTNRESSHSHVNRVPPKLVSYQSRNSPGFATLILVCV